MTEKDDEVITIVTMRVEDEPSPVINSIRGFVCNECGEEVWLCETSLPHMEDGYKICCNRCVAFQLLRSEDLEMRAADPELDKIFQESPELQEEFIEYMIARGLKDSGGGLRTWVHEGPSWVGAVLRVF